jgi:DNA polymerase-1
MTKTAIIISPNWGTYAEKYLEDLLVSFVAQRYSGELKFFLVDNETSEASRALVNGICTKILAGFSWMLLTNVDNAGFAKGNNVAMQQAIDEGYDYLALFNMDGLVAQARAQGFVETLLGRKRYLPNINSKIVMLAKAAERAAINAPIQGTAADMIKLAMIKIDQLIQSQYADRVKMLLQVHDELVFELPKNLVTEFATAIKPLMENVLDLSVPIVVDAKVGENWEEMTKL